MTYDKHCKVESGTYVQVHEIHNKSLELRMSGAIALTPSGNKQGGHFFLSLHTGKCILSNNWTELPMPNDIVETVHRLATASKKAGGITFTDKDGKEEDLMEHEHIPIPTADLETDQAIAGVEEHNLNAM